MAFRSPFETLVDIYVRSTDSFADRPLFGVKQSTGWSWTTYAQFRQATDAVRGGLASLGVQRGDAVAVIADNRPEWATAAYASYGLGAAYVPMYPAQLDKDWRYILQDCGAKVLFVASTEIHDRVAAFADQLERLEHIVVMEPSPRGLPFEDLRTRGVDRPAPLAEVQPEDVAGFIYTSGTTGNPKGVLLTHRNIAYNLGSVREVFPIAPTDRSLSFLPWAHSFGQVVELHGLFSRGASMGIAEAVEKIVDNLQEVRPTLLMSVPRIFNRIYDGVHKRIADGSPIKRKMFDAALANETRRRQLAKEGRTQLDVELRHRVFDALVFSKIRARFGGRLKYAISGGAAIATEVASFIDSLGIMVYEGYGLTETSPIATTNYPGARKIGSVGKPIPGISIEIDREASHDPAIGEVVVHGHNVMKGYHNREDENQRVFTANGGLRTGDLGYVDSDGYLFITGRIKEQYKLENGKYVAPAPLEERLKLSPFIGNVMIYGHNKPYNVALVVPDFEALEKFAQERKLASEREVLLRDAAVKQLYTEQLDLQAAEFKSFERVRRFQLIEADFTTENDMLTPSLKLKRRAVMERYGEVIQALYVE